MSKPIRLVLPFILLFVFVFAPQVILAQGSDDAEDIRGLSATIEELLARVEELKSRINDIIESEGRVPERLTCRLTLLRHTLLQGSTDAETDGEVSALQEFLAQDPAIYPEGLVTGYYGPLTEAAVKRWQAQNGIVSSGLPETTGFGQVGPLTRSALIEKCREIQAGIVDGDGDEAPPSPPDDDGVPPTATFSIGVRVITTDRLNVRSAAGLEGSLVGIQHADSMGTVIDGPREFQHRWWNIDYDSGPDGWSAEDWLTLVEGGDIGEDNDTTPPTISSIAVSDLTSNNAVISWSTDELTTGTVEYGLSTDYESAQSDTSLATSHSVSLTGLSSLTTYQYRVRSTDAFGNESLSSNQMFTTGDTGDSEPSGGILKSTDEVQIVNEVPCSNADSDAVVCNHFKVIVDADDPDSSLDELLGPINAILTIRQPVGTLLTNQWILLESGGSGRGYAITFGNAGIGGYSAGGNQGDDLIRWYNNEGFITLDVTWVCTERECGSDLSAWVKRDAPADSWTYNTGGAGFVGLSSRTRAIAEFAMANNGGRKLGAHGHSGGSGRLVTVLTRYGGEALFDTVVFDGGPVFAYIPWYCDVKYDLDGNLLSETPGPLGPMPEGQFDIKGNPLRYDQARDDNNGVSDADGVYSFCDQQKWDEANMLADSNIYQASDRDFAETNIAVVLGGRDTSPAPSHAQLWFKGYSYGGVNISALSAKTLSIRQGFCDPDGGGTYNSSIDASFSCSLWGSAEFPTANDVIYDPGLTSAGHGMAGSRAGAEAVFNAMMSVLNR